MSKDDDKPNNVFSIGGVTHLDVDPDDVLEGVKGQLETVLVMGVDKEGKLYFASSTGDGGELLWYIENFKRMLLEPEYV